MGALGMLLLLVGCMVVVHIFKTFLTWKPHNKIGGYRGTIRTIIRHH